MNRAMRLRPAGARKSPRVVATPQLAAITIGRLSHAADLDQDGTPDRLRLYVQPVDGWGRFVQMVGSLTATAAVLPAQGEARTVGRVALDPMQLRSAYRSGFGGTHYTIELPLEPEAAAEDSVAVRVMHEDARTGRTLTASSAVSVRPLAVSR